MENLVIELDSVKKHRNAQEWRFINRASCGEYDIVKTGDGDNIKPLCKAALDLGCNPDRLLEVRRGETVCFRLAPVDAWANPPDRRPEHLK